MKSPQVVYFEELRSLASGSISGTYATVGTPLSNRCRLVCLTNDTDGDMFFSVDGSTDHLFIAAGSFKLFDLTTNRLHHEQEWVLPPNTQFFVKQSSAPSTGSVYVEVLYGG